MKPHVLFAIIGAMFCASSTPAAHAQDIASAPPVVIKTEPEAGSKNVPPGEYKIKVTFSKEMANGSWSWCAAWTGSDAEVIGEPRYDTDQKTCVLTVRLAANKTYGWWLNTQKFQNFKDAQGHPAVPYLLVFETAGN